MTDEMQKARELALAVLLVGNAPPFEYYKGDTRWDVAMAKCKAENEATLDRVIAAVRAETLREVRGVVARVECVRCETDNPRVPCDCPEVLSRDALLAAIDALAQPEGTK